MQESQAQIGIPAESSVFGSPGDNDHCDSMWIAHWSCAMQRPWIEGLLKMFICHIYTHVSFPTAREVLFSIVSRTVYSSEGGKVEPVKEQGEMFLGQSTYVKSLVKAIGILP